MKGIFLAFLLATLLQLGNTHPESWVVCEWPRSSSARPPFDALVRALPVHNIISQFAFVSSSSSSSSSSFEVVKREAESFGFRVHLLEANLGQLYVAEFNPSVSKEAELQFRSLPSLTKILVKGFFSNNVAILKEVLEEDESSFPWISKVEFIPLKANPIIPSPLFNETRLFSYLSSLEPNPSISRLLEEVSEDELEKVVKSLSEDFFTRISSSSELYEAQTYLIGQFEGLGLQVSIQDYYQNWAGNVCADLPGQENPGSIVIAGAHYDSRSTNSGDPELRAPGAVDNGSGTAGMVEMARVLAKGNVTFSNTIRFCVWSGEEQGLIGSEAYARKMEEEKADIIGYLNADMTGYRLPNTRIIMGMKDRSVTEWLLDLSFEITALYVPSLPVDFSPSCCSDYISFYDHGFPAIGYFQNPGSASDYPSYHKSTDTYEKNSFEQMRLETQAVLAALATLAVPLS